MTVLAHVQDKANIFDLKVRPTLGQKYILTTSYAYNSFKKSIFIGSLFEINAYLNKLIIEEHKKVI